MDALSLVVDGELEGETSGSLTALLPITFEPREFVSASVSVSGWNPQSRIAIGAFAGSNIMAIQLPSGLVSGVVKVYEFSSDKNDASRANVLFIASNVSYKAYYGSIKVNFSSAERRINGKFFFVTKEGEKYDGEFNITA